jgi:hypothetical protein
LSRYGIAFYAAMTAEDKVRPPEIMSGNNMIT